MLKAGDTPSARRVNEGVDVESQPWSVVFVGLPVSSCRAHIGAYSVGNEAGVTTVRHA